jgi:hypothetical protein
MLYLVSQLRFFNQTHIGPLLWGMNYFDQNLVFRDQDTKEVFVFDTNGIWNEDTLNHKLIN